MPTQETITSDASPEEIEGRLEQLRQRDRAKAAPRPSRTKERRHTKVFDPVFDSDRPLRVRGEYERQEAAAKHREDWPDKYPAPLALDSIELMPDETMVTAENRAGRVMLLSPLLRLYRKGAISSESYQIGQCLQADLEMLMGSRSWASCGEELGTITDRPHSIRGIPGARLEAALRVRQCQAAVGFQEQFLTLVGMLEGFGSDELDRLWQRRKGNAKATVVSALASIAEAQVYEMLKHQPSVWAEAAA